MRVKKNVYIPDYNNVYILDFIKCNDLDIAKQLTFECLAMFKF